MTQGGGVVGHAGRIDRRRKLSLTTINQVRILAANSDPGGMPGNGHDYPR